MTVKRFIAAQGLDANSKTITNVTDPVNAQDAATKAYATNASNLASGTVNALRLPSASGSAAGIMSSGDFTKLQGIATGATANTGTVTTVSVASSNGLAGTVATSGTTPAITLSTTISGLLKGNGTAISAATAGSDYQAAITATGLLKGGGSGSVSAATAGTDYIAPYTSQTATYVLAAPTAAAGVPSFRALAATDIPSLDWSKISTGKPTTISGYGITDAYTKTETDSLLQGLDPKGSVKAATTADLGTLTAVATTLVGPAVVFPAQDGITLSLNDRVLVKNQAFPAQNGIYTLTTVGVAGTTAWVLTRSTDADAWTELVSAYVLIETGTTQADTGWLCTADAGGTLGTSSVPWSQFSGAGTFSAGTGLTKTGTTFSITNTTVTAAAYGSASSVGTFTVNAQGQLTAAASTAIAIASSAVSGLATSATTDTTNATNISAGTLPAARLPAHTGDVTSTAGSAALTLATSGVTAGTYNNSATVNHPLTVDAKGRITGVGASVTITPAWASITSTPTTLAGYGIADDIVLNQQQVVSQSADGNVNSQVTTYIQRFVLTTTTANQFVDNTWSGGKYAGRYVVHVMNGTNHQYSEIAVLTDKTVSNCIEYNVMTVPSTLILATFDVSSDGTLLATPTQTGNTIVHLQRMNMM